MLDLVSLSSYEMGSKMIREEMPKGLRLWLAEKSWTVVTWERMTGGFTSFVFRFRVRKKSGVELDAVYKQFSPGRTTEFNLYEGVLSTLIAYTPYMIASIHEADEKGVLMEDAGQSMKSIFALVDSARRMKLLEDAVKWLAQLHVTLEQKSQDWLSSGLLNEYHVTSAQVWSNDAVKGLTWLTEQGFNGIDVVQLAQIKDMVQRFYPSFADWLKGRSTLTHGDPHMENLLVHQGQFRLIDWEYSCVTVPQRDLTILLQDVLADELHQVARKTHWDYLRQHGWCVDDESFETAYQACFFDNTLMMLGWEIFKFRQGFLSRMELECIVTTKIKWLYESFQYLFNDSNDSGLPGGCVID